MLSRFKEKKKVAIMLQGEKRTKTRWILCYLMTLSEKRVTSTCLSDGRSLHYDIFPKSVQPEQALCGAAAGKMLKCLSWTVVHLRAEYCKFSLHNLKFSHWQNELFLMIWPLLGYFHFLCFFLTAAGSDVKNINGSVTNRVCKMGWN